MRSFCDVTRAELEALGSPGDAGVLLARLHRVTRWTDGEGGEAAPPLGKEARAFVGRHLDLSLPRVVSHSPSEDGATKLLLALADGATVETVHMPRAVKNPRVTLCISSQVGCAMGCRFCRTAEMGLVRNLTAAEMVGQVLAALRALGPDDAGRVSVVFMGMGEPLANVDAVLRAVAVLCEPSGLGLAASRITVSTAGLVPGIEALGRASLRPGLALSVNATTDEGRMRTMPLTKRHGLAELRAALLAFPARPHEKLMLEYVLLAGENDTDEDAHRLADFASGYRHMINVIPWNAFAGAPFRAPTEERVQAFAAVLHARGCLVTVRRSRGQDVAGACGQLATDATRKRRLGLAPT